MTQNWCWPFSSYTDSHFSSVKYESKCMLWRVVTRNKWALCKSTSQTSSTERLHPLLVAIIVPQNILGWIYQSCCLYSTSFQEKLGNLFLSLRFFKSQLYFPILWQYRMYYVAIADLWKCCSTTHILVWVNIHHYAPYFTICKIVVSYKHVILRDKTSDRKMLLSQKIGLWE